MRRLTIGPLLLLLCVLLGGATVRAQSPACTSESDWSVCYAMTSTDGLSVYSGLYRGVQVFDSATLPEMHVHYQRFTLSDELGIYAIPPAGPTEKVSLDNGFEVRQAFMIGGWPSCGTHRYVQLWRFFADGRFEPRLVIQGPGEQGPHTYVAYWRLDLDVAGAAGDRFRQWSTEWVEHGLEGKYPHVAPVSPQGYEWDHFDGGYHYSVAPMPNDDANWWVLRYQLSEGETDLPVQKPSEFPDQWVDGESIEATDQVVSYASDTDKLSIRVDMPLYLCTARPVTTSAGDTTQLPDVELHGGDADLSGLINVLDLVIIGANFYSQPPGDWWADINSDGEVNVFDLVTAGSNYRRSCPTDWIGE